MDWPAVWSVSVMRNLTIRIVADAWRSCRGDSARSGMSLIELLIVIGMLSILAAVVVPMFGTTSDMARTEAMASNAAQIRGLVIHHAGVRDVPLSPQGYPQNIVGAWFKVGLPDHSWTSAPLVIEHVVAASNVTFPAVKTFDPSVPGAFNAWYNPANGRFCVRIPAKSTPAATLQLFNDVNKSNATSLAQTTG
jgi:prepilin-type N-terminal cleavage/methylation domain-containing protein